MIIIRETKQDDRCSVVALIKAFYDEVLCDRGEIFDYVKCCRSFDDLIVNPNTISFVAEDDGLLVGTVSAFMCERPFFGGLVANELIWYVLPQRRKCGIKLLRIFEQECRERGCDYIAMVGFTGSKVEHIYDKLGYTCKESSYVKTIRG